MKSHEVPHMTRDLLRKSTPVAVLYTSLKDVSNDARLSIRISCLSSYSDNVWDLSKEFPSLPPESVRLRFDLVNFDDGTNITMPGYESYLSSVKEYFYSLIVDPPSSHPKWSTCCSSLRRGVRSLLRFMHESEILKFSDLECVDLSCFLLLISGRKNKSGDFISNRTLMARVYSLSWLYEQSGKINDGLQHWPFGESSSETEWCNENAQKKIPKTASTTPEMPDEVAIKLISCAIQDLSLAEILIEIKTRFDIYIKKQSAARWEGTALESFPWEEYGLDSESGKRKLEARLCSACYILISLLSGMRYHEVVNLKYGRSRNWSRQEIISDGGIRVFYFLISQTNKLQADATEYLWQTVPYVEVALSAMERCFSGRYIDGNIYLFASPGGYSQLSLKTVNSNLKKFVNFHKIEYGGHNWKLATHQFRKKFSRIMVRQGLGLVALQNQLKHFDIEMTRIYGDMSLYAELQQEKFRLSQEKYEELISGQELIIGGGAQDILEYRKIFIGMTAYERETFLNDLPKKALIEQLDDGLCMFRPKKALCGGDKVNCRPADCNNAILPAVSMKRTLLWRKSENQRLLVFFKNNPLKTANVQQRISDLNKLLSQLEMVSS